VFYLCLCSYLLFPRSVAVFNGVYLYMCLSASWVRLLWANFLKFWEMEYYGPYRPKRFGGVHAFGYNSAESESIWMKSGTLWVHCWGLACQILGAIRLLATVWQAGKIFCPVNDPSTVCLVLIYSVRINSKSFPWNVLSVQECYSQIFWTPRMPITYGNYSISIHSLSPNGAISYIQHITRMAIISFTIPEIDCAKTNFVYR